MQISKSLEDTEKIAKDFALKITPQNSKAVVVCLYGELGSGKTTFTKYIAKTFGIEEVIQSPTFVIEKIYRIVASSKQLIARKKRGKISKQQLVARFEKFIHIDAYRLESGEEIQKLGWDDIISDSKNLIVVEWPENIKEVIPKNCIKIRFEHISDKERKITIEV